MVIAKEVVKNTLESKDFYGEIKITTTNEDEYYELEGYIHSFELKPSERVLVHCNIKENAEAIACILDFDVAGRTYPLATTVNEQGG